MEMRHPFEAYVKFWEAISGNAKERLSPELAASKLERHFTGMTVHEAPERSVVVLLLDEIDFLMTGKQTVVYNFFDWPKRSFEITNGPRLIVIGISNTVNFPTLLKPSVRSRLGSSRCDFKAYTSNGIMDILKSKIQPKKSGYPVFDKDAIVFAARKIGSLTGDIRQAMQMCKAAAETVMQEVENGTRNDPKATPGRPMVRIKDLQRVYRDKNGSVLSQAIASSAPLEALLLIAIAALGESTHDIGEIMTKTESIANSSGIPEYNPPPSFQEMMDMLNRLAEARLVRLRTERSSMTTFRASQGGSGGAWPSIALNVDTHDILSALRQTEHSQLAQKHLSFGM
jgi:origin recognition complex subunit 1